MKLIYLTNIPAPYRNRRFNLMQELFPSLGIEFEVWYLAWLEPNRDWIIDKKEMEYPYKVFKGFHPVIKGIFAHVNPGLLLKLRSVDYDFIIVGGMGSPTHMLAPFFIPKRKTKILSIETNLNSVTRTTGVALKLKKLLTRKYNGFQVTGRSSQRYIEWLLDDRTSSTFITLPNIVDSKIFNDEVRKLKEYKGELLADLDLSPNKQIWICPTRLSQEKGILDFLPNLADTKNVTLLIIGDGPQRSEVEECIRSLDLSVQMIDFVQQEELIKYYSVADLFMLPSTKDASPLTPIEAIAAGLPLFVSNLIGNYEDVVEEGLNGWGFNPNDTDEIKIRIGEIEKTSGEKLKAMGEKSLEIYASKFDEERCVEAYGKQIVNYMDSVNII